MPGRALVTLALAGGLALGYCSGARDRDRVAAELATAMTRAAALDTALGTLRDSLAAALAQSQALDSAQRRADAAAIEHRRRAESAAARRPALPDTVTVVAREVYDLALAELADLRAVVVWQDTAIRVRDARIRVLEGGITAALAELEATRDTLGKLRQNLQRATQYVARGSSGERCARDAVLAGTAGAVVGAFVGKPGQTAAAAAALGCAKGLISRR